MFGYVLPPLEALPRAEADRFRRIYCGLCRTLGARYGPAARMILNYDFTYLAILLSEPEEPEPLQGRCPASPVRRRAYLPSSPALELAADESVILAWWQLRDGAADHGFWKGTGYRAAAGALGSAYGGPRRPGRNSTARSGSCLGELAALEAERCPSMDAGGGHLRPAAAERGRHGGGPGPAAGAGADALPPGPVGVSGGRGGRPEGGRRLRQLQPRGPALRPDGRELDEESRQAFARTLDHSVHMIATAFELWDFGVWRPLLESTVYTGLFAVGRAVLEGTFRKLSPREYREKHKKAEETT